MMAKERKTTTFAWLLVKQLKAIKVMEKVERLVTDKETFDVDMVVLAVGFVKHSSC